MIFSAPTKNPESNPTASLYYTARCLDCEWFNALLADRIERLAPSDIQQRRHWLSGRYENLYVAIETLPDARVVLDLAIAQAAHILGRAKRELSLGWWINIMRHGDVTQPHAHDAGDEWLSGVYYVRAPPGSGVLRIHAPATPVEVIPRAGEFVFFAPDVVHEVTVHRGTAARIALAFNVGPANPV